MGRGVPGLSVSTVHGGSNLPMVIQETEVFSQVTEDLVTTENLAYWTFANADPGETVLDVVDAEGRAARCHPFGASTTPGWSWGTVTPPARVRVLARPGFSSTALVECVVE
jgi:hypothetical protein